MIAGMDWTKWVKNRLEGNKPWRGRQATAPSRRFPELAASLRTGAGTQLGIGRRLLVSYNFV